MPCLISKCFTYGDDVADGLLALGQQTSSPVEAAGPAGPSVAERGQHPPTDGRPPIEPRRRDWAAACIRIERRLPETL